MRSRFAAACVCLLLGSVLAATGDDDERGKFRYDKGFKFESADERFSLEIDNRVQVRFTFENPEDDNGKGSFRLRRYKFKMSGTLFEDWKYKLQMNFAGQGDQSIPIGGDVVTLEQDDALEDAYVPDCGNRETSPVLATLNCP